jgi:hypothetical protein
MRGNLFLSRMKATSRRVKTPKPVTSDDANVVRLMSCDDAPTPELCGFESMIRMIVEEYDDGKRRRRTKLGRKREGRCSVN